MFAIGDKEWPGLSKLAEECGEVLQVIGKLIQTRGEFKHWNVPDLKVALEDEIADVQAACVFVMLKCNLDQVRLSKRFSEKLDKFEAWHDGDSVSPRP